MDINDLKKLGTVIKFEDAPYQVIFSQHSRTGRGRAFVRTKLKNLITRRVLEKTFNASDKIEEADISQSKVNFLYQKGDEFYFMDATSYEQFFLNQKTLSDKIDFLKEGMEVEALVFNKVPVNIRLPKKVTLEVIEAPPGIKGDSATTPSKIVTLENGAKLTVPIFIKKGDKIIVNTETGEYVSRK